MDGLRARLRKNAFLNKLRHPYKTIAEKNEIKKCQAELPRLKNTAPTIISNDCISGVLMRNYNLPCRSPMINCAMFPDEFIRYLVHLEHYMGCELREKPDAPYPFPVGELVSEEFGNIEIRFMHYASFHDAQVLWRRRTKRIDLSNVNVILDLNPYMEATQADIDAFLSLPYNKVIITTDAFRDTPCSHYIELGKKKMVKGIMLKYKNLAGYRYFEDFDFIGWLNNNADKQNED